MAETNGAAETNGTAEATPAADGEPTVEGEKAKELSHEDQQSEFFYSRVLYCRQRVQQCSGGAVGSPFFVVWSVHSSCIVATPLIRLMGISAAGSPYLYRVSHRTTTKDLYRQAFSLRECNTQIARTTTKRAPGLYTCMM